MSTTGPEHDRLLRSAVQNMGRLGITNVCADHLVGYVQPDVLSGFIPDATGHYQNRLCIVECETGDGLRAAHTQEQLKAFAFHATLKGGYFIVAVSAANQSEATQLLRVIGCVNATVWTF